MCTERAYFFWKVHCVYWLNDDMKTHFLHCDSLFSATWDNINTHKRLTGKAYSMKFSRVFRLMYKITIKYISVIRNVRYKYKRKLKACDINGPC